MNSLNSLSHNQLQLYKNVFVTLPIPSNSLNSQSITRNSLSLDQAGKDKDNAGNEPSFHGSQGLRLKKRGFGPKNWEENIFVEKSMKNVK